MTYVYNHIKIFETLTKFKKHWSEIDVSLSFKDPKSMKLILICLRFSDF